MPKTFRLLVIAYAFPPYMFSPGGMIRVVKFLKYLERDRPDWTIDVLTAGFCGREKTMSRRAEYLLNDIPPNVNVFRIDDPQYVVLPKRSLLIRSINYFHRVLENQLSKYRLINRSKKFTKPRLIPDRFISWHAPVMDWIMNSPKKYDLLFATIDPYSVGLLGLKVKQALEIPLIIDIRDDWSHSWIGADDHRMMTEMKMEKRIVEGANAVVLVTDWALESYKLRYPQYEYFSLISTQFFEKLLSNTRTCIYHTIQLHFENET